MGTGSRHSIEVDMSKLTDDQKASVFRAYCVGFGHTPGTPISKAGFTLKTGRPYDIYGHDEVMEMVREITVAAMLGELSVCQKAILHQLKSAGVITALLDIQAAKEKENE